MDLGMQNNIVFAYVFSSHSVLSRIEPLSGRISWGWKSYLDATAYLDIIFIQHQLMVITRLIQKKEKEQQLLLVLYTLILFKIERSDNIYKF